MRFSALLPAAAAALLICAPAGADYVSGAFARQSAMGGAGLALVDQPGSANYTNPAALAYSSHKWGVNFPGAGVRFRGVSFHDASGLGSEALGLSGSDVRELALKLSHGEAMVDAHSAAGVTLLRQGIGYEAQGHARAVPDAALRAWADNHALPLTGASSEITAASVESLPTVALGSFVPGWKNGRLAAGARVRVQKLTGRMQRVTFTDESGSANITDIQTEHRSGLGIDAGFLLQPAGRPGESWALVVDNLVHPTFHTSPQKTMVSVGAAKRLPRGITLAADAVNLTNACSGGLDLRVGAELKPVSFFALRAGVASHSGVTAGVQLAGFNFAWAGRAPFVVSQSLRF